MVLRVQAPRFLALAALLAMGVAVVQASVGIGGKDERSRIVVVDCDKNFHVVGLHDMSDPESRPMVRYFVRLATYAMLERGSEGRSWINNRLVEQMFLPGATRKVQDIDTKDAGYFKERSVVQMPDYREDEVRFRFEDGACMANVRGALVRDGKFRGRTFRETVQFRLVLTFARNPYDGPNLYLPYAVRSFTLNTWVDGGGS
jgi:hypothetical protein